MTTTAPERPALAVEGGRYLEAQRDAPLGGQAVLEGVMMRGVRHWAVAVRKPVVPAQGEPAAAIEGDGGRAIESDGVRAVVGEDGHAAEGEDHAAEGEIEVRSFPLRSVLARHRVLRLPIVRGVVALGSSLAIGFRALEVSANAQLAPQEEQEISRGMWAGTVVVALAFAVVLFFLIPVGLTSLVKHQLGSSLLFWLVEGAIRTSIFLGYLLLLSRVRDLRRVFE